MHVAVLSLVIIAVGALEYFGSATGGDVWLLAMMVAGPLAIGTGMAVHGLPTAVPSGFAPDARRYVSPRAAGFFGLAALLAFGILIVRWWAPLPPIAALAGAVLIAPAGYLLADQWGSAVLVLTDVEAAFMIRGRIAWRAPLGNDTWINLDNTGGRHPVSFVAFGTRVREFGRVVDHTHLARPQFLELVRDLRSIAASHPEWYVVDQLGGLITSPPATEVSLARTSLSQARDARDVEYELPPNFRQG